MKDSKWGPFRLLAVFVAFECEPFLENPFIGQGLKSQLPRDHVMHDVLSGQLGLQTLDTLASTYFPVGGGWGLLGAPWGPVELP